jgi:hypothetical protein
MPIRLPTVLAVRAPSSPPPPSYSTEPFEEKTALASHPHPATSSAKQKGEDGELGSDKLNKAAAAAAAAVELAVVLISLNSWLIPDPASEFAEGSDTEGP